MKTKYRWLGIFLAFFLTFLTQSEMTVFAQEAEAATVAGDLGWITLIPPAIAIILAFISKDVIMSLSLGVFSGAVILQLYSGTNFIMAFVEGFLGVVQYAVDSLADPWNAGIILQVMTIGGLIGVITKSGGARAVAEGLAKYAKGPISTQLITWILGLLVFFDDYANALIVGPIMRPVFDKMKNSRERLAFTVDATAAPVAGIALVSTWIGYELGLINDTFTAMGESINAYGFFLETLPYRFYNIFMLAFVVITAITLREFGPMKKAQLRSRDTGQVMDPKSKMHKESSEEQVKKGSIWNALVPIVLLILLSFVGFYTNGRAALVAEGMPEIVQLFEQSPYSFLAIREAFGASDASVVIFQAALAASIVAILMGVFQKRFTIGEGIETWIGGMKSLIITAVVLLLAWSLSTNMADLGTAQFLVSLLGDVINPIFLPSLIFIFGAVISFATGTSYGTMGILIPLAIPVASAMAPNDPHLTIVSSAAVLAGAIFGDHSSPISDTTILSSIGAGSDLMDHVKTQLPYALSIGAFAIVFGYIPAAAGLSAWILIPIAIILIVIFVYLVGKKIDTTKPETSK